MKTSYLKSVMACASLGALYATHLPAVVDENELQSRSSTESSDRSFSSSSSKLCRAGDLLGRTVVDSSHQKVGEVRDVLVDPKTGRVPFILVSRGGFFGAGDHWIVMPVGSLAPISDSRDLTVSLDSDKLKNAPTWDRGHGNFDQAWASDAYRYYDLEPYWSAASGTDVREPAGAEIVTTRQYQDYVIEDPDERADRILRLYQKGKGEAARIDRLLQEGKLELDPTADSVAWSQSTLRHTPVMEDRALSVESTPSGPAFGGAEGQFMRSSDLMGFQLKNTLDERIGEIKDIVIDVPAGRVAYYVISFENRMVSMPPDVMERSLDHGKTFVVNLDRQKLSGAPAFEQSNWVRAGDQAYVTEVYRFYGVQVYFQTSGNQIREPAGAELKRNELMKDPAGADREKMKDSPPKSGVQKIEPRDSDPLKPGLDPTPTPAPENNPGETK